MPVRDGIGPMEIGGWRMPLWMNGRIHKPIGRRFVRGFGFRGVFPVPAYRPIAEPVKLTKEEEIRRLEDEKRAIQEDIKAIEEDKKAIQNELKTLKKN